MEGGGEVVLKSERCIDISKTDTYLTFSHFCRRFYPK